MSFIIYWERGWASVRRHVLTLLLTKHVLSLSMMRWKLSELCWFSHFFWLFSCVWTLKLTRSVYDWTSFVIASVINWVSVFKSRSFVEVLPSVKVRRRLLRRLKFWNWSDISTKNCRDISLFVICKRRRVTVSTQINYILWLHCLNFRFLARITKFRDIFFFWGGSVLLMIDKWKVVLDVLGLMNWRLLRLHRLGGRGSSKTKIIKVIKELLFYGLWRSKERVEKSFFNCNPFVRRRLNAFSYEIDCDVRGSCD